MSFNTVTGAPPPVVPFGGGDEAQASGEASAGAPVGRVGQPQGQIPTPPPRPDAGSGAATFDTGDLSLLPSAEDFDAAIALAEVSHRAKVNGSAALSGKVDAKSSEADALNKEKLEKMLENFKQMDKAEKSGALGKAFGWIVAGAQILAGVATANPVLLAGGIMSAALMVASECGVEEKLAEKLGDKGAMAVMMAFTALTCVAGAGSGAAAGGAKAASAGAKAAGQAASAGAQVSAKSTQAATAASRGAQMMSRGAGAADDAAKAAAKAADKADEAAGAARAAQGAKAARATKAADKADDAASTGSGVSQARTQVGRAAEAVSYASTGAQSGMGIKTGHHRKEAAEATEKSRKNEAEAERRNAEIQDALTDASAINAQFNKSIERAAGMVDDTHRTNGAIVHYM